MFAHVFVGMLVCVWLTPGIHVHVNVDSGSHQSGVTTYVMAGISEPFDHLPCLNYKLNFFARKSITIYLPQNKNVSAVPDNISNGIYEDRLLKCG